MKDLFGRAILDYQLGNDPQDLITETSISEADDLPVSYLFRTFDQMPKIERLAMELSDGHVLDVGCGAGSHSLYLQNTRRLTVTSVDISSNAIQTCKLRGLKNAIVSDVMNINGKFDTILLLMNGGGMCGKIVKMDGFLRKLKSILNVGGRILLDSSDIIYMYDEDEVDALKSGQSKYYGEVKYSVAYKGESEKPFDWLYIDYNTLSRIAGKIGLKSKLLIEGNHYDYLAELTHQR